nr:MAG TPA: hypothetical protein [Caudoviricetes sp.]
MAFVNAAVLMNFLRLLNIALLNLFITLAINAGIQKNFHI